MIKVSQHPREITRMTNWVRSRMPHGTIKSYLEIGSYAGESLEYVSKIMASGAKVVLVDLGDNQEARAKLIETCEKFEGEGGLDIHLVTGDSTSEKTVEAVRDLCPPRAFDLGFIDGCHDFGYVVRDIGNYGPLCSYLALHDVNPNAIPRQIEKHGYEKPCAAHVWSVLKLSRDVEEFIDEDADKPMGIGLLRGITVGR